MTAALGRIALSFSGGGGRAAGFHLGTLACLDRLDILKDVSILSTVSGGSFIGASYVLALKEAPPGEDLHVTFDRYFKTFRTVLIETRLLPQALQHMARGKVKVPSGRDNLVIGLAQVYNDTFLHNARFGVLWSDREIHLKDIIFNATEFKTGMAFRFQKSDNVCVIGNDHVRISEAHAMKMRLADVVASSSCIPVGLEPIVFPDDFHWPDNEPGLCAEIKTALKECCGVDAIPIMDGGVYDNQGIESVLLAVRREPRHELVADEMQLTDADGLTGWFRAMLASPKELGTFIISDTPLLSGNELAAEAAPGKRGKVSLQHINIAMMVMTVMALLTIAYLAGHLVYSHNQLDMHQWDDLFVYVIPMVLAAVLTLLLMSVRLKVRRLLGEFPQSGHHSWVDVRRLKVDQVIDMVRLRLSSTWALTTWVYFNRIRQLGYDLVRTLPAARKHLITHEIHDLLPRDIAKGMPGADLSGLPDWLTPSAAARQVAERASNLPTKLWFDHPDELDDAIACGRMTMCFNVLAHLERHFPKRDAVQQAVYDRARADWARWQENPRAGLPPDA